MTARSSLAAAAAAMVLLASPALADGLEITNLMGKVPTEQEIIDGLITKTGLRVERDTTDAASAAAEPSLGEIALEVRFEFDSAQLTPAARQVLGNLADALSSDQLASFSFRVEGHTDAVGSETYNQNLSERRAAAVRDFLSRDRGIPVDRLLIVGKGESEPLDPGDPGSGVNRRVEIVNLGQ